MSTVLCRSVASWKFCIISVSLHGNERAQEQLFHNRDIYFRDAHPNAIQCIHAPMNKHVLHAVECAVCKGTCSEALLASAEAPPAAFACCSSNDFCSTCSAKAAFSLCTPCRAALSTRVGVLKHERLSMYRCDRGGKIALLVTYI